LPIHQRKNLFIDKDKKDRIIILPTNNFKTNSDYVLLAKDDTHTIILVKHNDDVLIEYNTTENKKDTYGLAFNQKKMTQYRL